MKQLPHFPDQLTVNDEFYAKQLVQLWHWLLVDDQVMDVVDVVGGDEIVEAQIIAKDKLVIAGVEEVSFLLSKKDFELSYDFLVEDGDLLMPGQQICILKGARGEILRCERIILNFLGRFSGIATSVNSMQSTLKHAKIAATRKTVWGRLDKKAVVVGGGLSHRLALGQCLMYKDNDWAWLEKLDEKAWNDLFITWESWPMVIVELENDEQIRIISFVLQQLSNKNCNIKLGVLLDNYSPASLLKVLQTLPRDLLAYIEVSGGITRTNIFEYDISGVDVISLGEITKSVKMADLSLEIL